MLDNKLLILLGALLWANITFAAAQCKDCIGDSLLKLTEVYDQGRRCWFSKNHHELLKVKLNTLEAVIECLEEVQKVNNKLTEKKCHSNVKVKPCDMTDTDALSECLMSSIRSLIQAYSNQEQCHGEVFNTEVLKITQRFMKGNIAGWHGIYPDCQALI